jgi:DNA-directed RNA polymerase specialized sigma24 family protein
LLNLRALVLHDEAAWSAALPVIRRIAQPIIRSMGISDVEDLFAEVLAAVVEPIEDLQIAEQIPPLVCAITRRRATDHLRRESAAKRDGSQHLENTAAISTLTELDLQDILDLCATALSPAQWEMIDRLILQPTDTHTSLIADARLLTELQINPRSSEATRRRRLHDSLHSALDTIRRLLDLP